MFPDGAQGYKGARRVELASGKEWLAECAPELETRLSQLHLLISLGAFSLAL